MTARIQLADPGRILVLGDAESVTISRAPDVPDDDGMARFGRRYARLAGLQLYKYQRPYLVTEVPDHWPEKALILKCRSMSDLGRSLEVYTLPGAEAMPDMPEVDLSLGVLHAVLPGEMDIRNVDDLRAYLHPTMHADE